MCFTAKNINKEIAKQIIEKRPTNCIGGPFSITVEANHKRSVHLKEILDLSNVPNHIDGGTSMNVHLKLIDKKTVRIL